MANKEQRDEVALRAFEAHQKVKAERWKVYKKAAVNFWYDRIVYEWCLLENAWGQPELDSPQIAQDRRFSMQPTR